MQMKLVKNANYHGNAFSMMPDWLLIDEDEKGGWDRTKITLANAFKIYVYDVRDYDELVPLNAGAGTVFVIMFVCIKYMYRRGLVSNLYLEENEK